MAKSPKDPTQPSRAGRLLQAVERVRAEPARAVVVRRMEPRAATEATKPANRPVRFPKETGALRQHVAEVQDRRAGESPKPRLRLRADASTPPTKIRSGPSPALRDQVAAARQGTAAAVGRGALEGARDLGVVSGPLTTVRDLGRLVRARREDLRLNQMQLALAAGTGRRFISDLEGGKPTAELGRTLEVLRALGLQLSAVAADG